MVEENPEVCEERVMDILPDLNCTELENLCLELGLTVGDDIKGNRAKVYKFVMKYLLSLEIQEGEGGRAKFVQVFGYLKTNHIDIKGDDPSQDENKSKIEDAGVKTDGGPKLENYAGINFSHFIQELSKALVVDGSGGDESRDLASALQQKFTGSNKDPPNPNKHVTVKPAMVMKDLKIKGVIGSESEKDRLKFSGLCYQIRNAQKIGYSEQTICDAILTAIAPSNHLKTFFEMRPSLSINSMLGKLKNFYKEKDYTDTLLELSKTAQTSQESCLEYCTRLMCLRDKVILLSNEEGCPQDLNGLSKTFLRSVFVGMRNGNVRNELRESCKNLYQDQKKAEKDDDLLMRLIAEAMATETARAERLKEAKEAEVNLMQTNMAAKDKDKRSVTRDSEKTLKVSPLAQIDELRIQQENQGQTLSALVAQVVEIRDVLVGGDRPSKAVPSVSVQAQSGASSSLQPALQQQAKTAQPSQNFMPQLLNQSQNNQNFSQNQLPCNPSPAQQPNQHQGNPIPHPNIVPTQYQPYIPPHRRRSRCEKCERENRYRCFHCFYCGSSAHRIFECPTKN